MFDLTVTVHHNKFSLPVEGCKLVALDSRLLVPDSLHLSVCGHECDMLLNILFTAHLSFNTYENEPQLLV